LMGEKRGMHETMPTPCTFLLVHLKVRTRAMSSDVWVSASNKSRCVLSQDGQLVISLNLPVFESTCGLSTSTISNVTLSISF